MAGINAALMARDEAPFILRRDEAYAGVLIDDLITKGTNEPYRMFTSRVEYRLLVREDNTDERLGRHGHRFGLITDEEMAGIDRKYAQVRQIEARLKEIVVPRTQINPVLEGLGSSPVTERAVLYDILKRPHVMWAHVACLDGELASASVDVASRVEYDVKYEGFIVHQQKEVERFRHLENIRIPPELDYGSITAISYEVREKLKRFMPATLGQANRISGVTPAAISVLMIYLRKYFAEKKD